MGLHRMLKEYVEQRFRKLSYDYMGLPWPPKIT